MLNRFAKDVGFLDDLLPYVFLEYLLVRDIIYRRCSYFSFTTAGPEVCISLELSCSHHMVHHLPNRCINGCIHLSTVVLPENIKRSETT